LKQLLGLPRRNLSLANTLVRHPLFDIVFQLEDITLKLDPTIFNQYVILNHHHSDIQSHIALNIPDAL
jgi:hypothetical protein